MTRLLGIKPGETAMVGWVVAAFAVVQSSHGVGANAADALFFLRFGVDALPVMIMISGVAVMVFVLAYAMGLGARGPQRWLPLVSAIAGLLAIVEWVGVVADVRGIYPVVWVSTQVIIMVTLTMVWNAAGAACTTRQAKRLFPIFATAGVAGGVIGNVLTGPLAAVLGTENLILVQAVLLAGGSALLIVARRFFIADESPPPASMRVELAETVVVVRKSRLLRLAALVAVIMNALFYLVYFPFSESVAASFGSEQRVAAFLGLFSSVATAATFLVSLLVTNRLFARFGFVVSLMILPIAYAGGFALWLVLFTLSTAALVRGVQWVTVNAIGGTAYPALFNVVTGRRRGELVAFMTAVPAQIGVVLGGLVLVVSGSLPDRAVFALGLVVAVSLLVLVIRLRPAYLEAIVTAVRQGLVGVFDAPAQGLLTPQDGDTRRVLVSYLRDSRPEARVVALAGLARLEGSVDATEIEPLLDDENAMVRSAAFDSVCVIDPERVSDHAATAIDDEVPEVRIQVLHHLGAHAEGDGASVARHSLADPDPRVRAAAAVVVGGEEGAETFDQLLTGSDAGGIVAALEEISRHQIVPDVDLEPLLGHDDARVRAGAASVVGSTGVSPETLLPYLDDASPGVRAAAAAAMADSEEGCQLLLGVLHSGSVIATDAALNELTPMDDLVSDFTGWAQREAERAALLRSYSDALDAHTDSVAGEYLRRILMMRTDRLLRWVMLGMTTEQTQSVMSIVEQGVHSTDLETRAQAIEALETIGARTVLSILLPLLEPDHVPGSMSEIEALRLLSGDFDPWLERLATTSLDEMEAAASLEAADVATYPPMSATDQQPILSPIDRVLFLQRVPMFAELDPEDLELVARVTTERRYEPSARIYKEGDKGDEMLVIVRGSAVVSTLEGSTRRQIQTYGPGEHVGELALLRAGVRSADVTAGDDGAHGLVLTRTELMSVLEERPSVMMGLLTTLARRLAEQTSNP
ncbi:MAG: cyclic nucleotide-binding domain-containing protein [Actinomycetota bacterium]|nr:cyclic nucleotide-binding domain-containing protein [Actinomycetota bacterium]